MQIIQFKDPEHFVTLRFRLFLLPKFVSTTLDNAVLAFQETDTQMVVSYDFEECECEILMQCVPSNALSTLSMMRNLVEEEVKKVVVNYDKDGEESILTSV